MGTNEFTTLEEFKEYTVRYYRNLESVVGKENLYTNEVRVCGYIDMLHVATTLIKLCVIATDPEAPEISKLVKNTSVDINRILELALQFLPYDEVELLDEIKEIFVNDQK
jgi:hypothetical protein